MLLDEFLNLGSKKTYYVVSTKQNLKVIPKNLNSGFAYNDAKSAVIKSLDYTLGYSVKDDVITFASKNMSKADTKVSLYKVKFIDKANSYITKWYIMDRSGKGFDVVKEEKFDSFTDLCGKYDVKIKGMNTEDIKPEIAKIKKKANTLLNTKYKSLKKAITFISTKEIEEYLEKGNTSSFILRWDLYKISKNPRQEYNEPICQDFFKAYTAFVKELNTGLSKGYKLDDGGDWDDGILELIKENTMTLSEVEKLIEDITIL